MYGNFSLHFCAERRDTIFYFDVSENDWFIRVYDICSYFSSSMNFLIKKRESLDETIIDWKRKFFN